MTDLLKRQNVSVDHEGQLVVFKVGNATMKIPYDVAFQISTWMRYHAKIAKRIAGDTSRHWTIIGRLEAVENGEPIS